MKDNNAGDRAMHKSPMPGCQAVSAGGQQHPCRLHLELWYSLELWSRRKLMVRDYLKRILGVEPKQ